MNWNTSGRSQISSTKLPVKIVVVKLGNSTGNPLGKLPKGWVKRIKTWTGLPFWLVL